MTDLSGRVLDLEKQLLGLPTQDDWSAVRIATSQRFNVVEGTLADLTIKFERLNTKVINLQLYGNTGHTGNHQHIFNEVPAGNANGTNDTFTLASTPYPSTSLQLYKNGILQKPGAGNDFSLSVRTITFASDNIPPASSNLLASYTTP